MNQQRCILVATALTSLVLAACGGGDDGATENDSVVIAGADELVIEGGATATDAAAAGGDALAGVSDAPAAGSDEELARQFAQCMRDEGIDWPDPVLNADGSVELFPANIRPGAGGADSPFDDPDLEAAIGLCQPLIEGASFLPDTAGGFDAETQDQFLEFTQCLRDNGLDVDDPDLGNIGGGGLPAGGPGGLFGDGFDPDDPAVQDAIGACQGLFTGGPLAGRG